MSIICQSFKVDMNNVNVVICIAAFLSYVIMAMANIIQSHIYTRHG